MKFLTVRHATRYRYAQPATFGAHRLMLRPRDSHDLRLVDAELTLSPPGDVHWTHDVFGNSIAHVEFAQGGTELLIDSTLHLERYAVVRPRFTITEAAQNYPFVYSANDRSDLGRLLDRHYPDPHGVVDQWAKGFVTESPMPTLDLLRALNAAFKTDFTYNVRYEEGTQSPLETLDKRSGSCRDYALLFMEAVRSLGFGARFVTGYLYDPAVDGGNAMQGAGATHAWADVYLPGAGWVEYDPTNGIIAGENLIRVAVTRDPSQALPISGSFTAKPSDFLGMTVEVVVTAQDPAARSDDPRDGDLPERADDAAPPVVASVTPDVATATSPEAAPPDVSKTPEPAGQPQPQPVAQSQYQAQSEFTVPARKQ
ncbi:MAG: transglutaminase family protein [Rhodopseudomonas sp.]|nr:transglutaminase family protein [Rhodopseudomonas sp.]